MNLKIEISSKTRGTNGTQTGTDTEKIKREAKENGEFIVSVSSDDKTLTSIAKKFNMSLTDFKNMTGLTKDTLQKGQRIKNIPTAKIDSGMGLASIARKNGMTLEQLCTLNGIPKDYKPQKDEYFYIFPQNNKNTHPTQTQDTTVKQPATNSAQTPITKPQPKTEQAKPLTAEDIADKLEEAADDYKGAVGKEAFDNVFNQINKTNVIDVVEKFQEKYGKSLINMISDEWSSDKEARKSAMTKIYDLVAEKKGIKNREQREEFINNLNEEFDSWGFVSTKKMDRIINGIIHPDQAEAPASRKQARTDNTGSNASHLSGKVYPNEIFHSTNGGKSKDITPTTMTTIKDRDGNFVNAGTLKSWALSGGKRDKGFKDVKDPFIVRPLPNYNTETKKLEAVTEVLEPTTDGNLSGKVVILNPGHGGYQQKNGFFDAGTVLSVKNAEGEEMPIEEWRVAQSYVEKISDNLRNRGAQVVIVSGAVKNGGMHAQKYLENMLAGKKGDDNVRDLMNSTDKSDMLFLSVHVESAKDKPDTKKCTVRYTKDIDKELADNINKHVNQGFIALTPTPDKDNLYVNRAAKGIPSSLLEIGNIANEKITNSLLSDYDQKKYAQCIADAIEETMLN
ncbi:MAG: N-acetylmuramoyl-L-alanine amidase [Brachyspira sp.]|nr:N-acetylmuramoyl-L-alanine amidase [Brachyspira sp.]